MGWVGFDILAMGLESCSFLSYQAGLALPCFALSWSGAEWSGVEYSGKKLISYCWADSTHRVCPLANSKQQSW